MSTNLGTFVLVHGAWHGGWCWKKLAPLLRAAGHQVFTPTLTGLGERSHLLTPDVGLDTHIQDIVAVLEYENLQEVVLLGHSYAGMVISAVAARARARVGQLVYLDAFVPQGGESLNDYVQLPAKTDGWRVPPPGPPQIWGVTQELDIAWMQERLGDQPLRSFSQAIDLSPEGSNPIPRTFVQTSDAASAPFFAEHVERAKRLGFRYRTLLSGGHDAMITQPQDLAAVLLEL